MEKIEAADPADYTLEIHLDKKDWEELQEGTDEFVMEMEIDGE